MPNPTIDGNGDKRWYNEHGQFHRLGGPAYEGANGDKAWWVNDKRHRIDGPACEWHDGDKDWYVNGKRLSSPLRLLKHGAKIQDIAEYLTPREIALCQTQE